MDPILNKNNIEDFLRFFEQKVGQKFDEETMRRWLSLDNTQLSQNTNKLLEHFGFNSDSEKMEVIREYILSTRKPDTDSAVKEEDTIPTPIEQSTEDYDIHTQTVDTPSYDTGVEKNSPPSSGRIIFVLLLIGVIAGAAWLWAKYSEYNGRAQIYSLGDNLNVRKDLNTDDLWPTRLYLFGKYRSSTDGQIHKTSTCLPLVDEELYNEYYKVYMDTSFMQYLMSGEETVGYVHSKYVTKNQIEYQRYLSVFDHFKDDYEEMERLPLDVRRIIVNAIYNYEELNGKILSPPCYKEPKPIQNQPMSVGVLDVKIGKAKQYYIICRIDGLYYTLNSNEEGSEIYLDKVRKEDGQAEVFMDVSGKFVKTNGPSKFGGLKWTSCDKEEVLYSYYKPFNVFVPNEYRKNPTPATPPTEIQLPDDGPEEFIDEVNFSE